MSLQAPRTSVFTFESAVHSDHVLQRLDEQRQQDVFCDMTVAVRDRSFRAHRSVLASCSEYFHSRVAGVAAQNPVITLPDEVTVEGFEPLLQFAYTSKLFFTKENIHSIHSTAEFLGFRDLESSCFDFLLPKFSVGKRSSQEVRRGGACCQNEDPGTSFLSKENDGRRNSFEAQSSLPSGGSGQTGFPSQCGQKSPKEERFCLQNCGSEMAPLSLDLAANSVCPMLPLPGQDGDRADPTARFCERDILEIGDVFSCGLPCELSAQGGVNPPELLEQTGRDVKQAVETLHAETNSNPAACAINTSVREACGDLLGPTEVGLDQRMRDDLSDTALTAMGQQEGFVERSSVEREVAEHLAKGFWSDLCPSQGQPPLPLDPMDQSSLAKATDFHWLKQLDLTSSVGDCPFLRDLGAPVEELNPRADALSQTEKSPCVSSTFNSADDSDLDTDGDAEANSKRAAEIQLPFPVEQISSLTRSAFQQLLRNYQLTPDQLEFVQDVRRRSKNRVAAQRCRKRKLDGIQHLECEIKRLKNEKDRLLQEQNELERNLEEMRQSLCGLCKNVSVDAGADHDQLQLLTKLSSSSPDFPLSLIKDEEAQITIEMVSSTSQCDPSGGPAGSVRSADPEVDAQSDSPLTCPVAASLINTCVDMNSGL